jgi:TRAP-type C4-dicarboxylate transport system permease small subunit
MCVSAPFFCLEGGKGMNFLERLLILCENGLMIVGGICLFALMALVVSDAGGRYFFNAPISGVYEISEFYLMIAIVFLSLAHTQRLKSHVRVELVLERLPVLLARTLEVLFLLATVIVFACITYVTARTGWTNIVLNRWTTGVVAIPTGPSWLIVAVGSGIFTLRLAFDALSLVIRPYPGDKNPRLPDKHSTAEPRS